MAKQVAGQPLASDALRSARWLLREAGSGSGTREMVEHALLPHLHQLHAAATLGSVFEAIARCVAQGLGISCLPRVLVQPLVDAGELVVLPTVLPQMQRYFSLVQRAGKRRSRAGTAGVCGRLPGDCAAIHGLSDRAAAGAAAASPTCHFACGRRFWPYIGISARRGLRSAGCHHQGGHHENHRRNALHLDLLTHEQHLQISTWIDAADTPEAILQMPASCGRPERASQAMGVNEDLLRPPALDAGNAVFG